MSIITRVYAGKLFSGAGFIVTNLSRPDQPNGGAVAGIAQQWVGGRRQATHCLVASFRMGRHPTRIGRRRRWRRSFPQPDFWTASEISHVRSSFDLSVEDLKVPEGNVLACVDEVVELPVGTDDNLSVNLAGLIEGRHGNWEFLDKSFHPGKRPEP